MAKSERASGKRGETHYNRKENGGGGKRFGKAAEGRDARPPRRDSGDARPARNDDAGERKSFRKNDDTTRKPFRRDEGAERKPYRKDGDRPFRPRNEEGGSDGRKPFRADGDRKPFRKDDDRKPPYRRAEGDKPFERKSYGGSREERPFRKSFGEDKRDSRDRPSRATGSEGERKPFARRQDDGEKKPFKRRDEGGEKKPFTRREDSADKRSFARKREEGTDGDRKKSFGDRGDKPFKRREDDGRRGERKSYDRTGGSERSYPKKPTRFEGHEFDEASNPAKPGKWDTEAKAGPMTLNKYLAHAGVSSRRDAAVMIKEGKVAVNGAVLTEPGYRVKPNDKITLDGKEMKPQRHFVYVLLNKPKDFITTTEDDRGRRTVMELVSGATEDRLYPVGRLDRNTTGVLLLTNDGDLAQRLSHPKYESKKIYQVTLDKDVTKRDFDQIIEGVKLEDGIAKVDRLAYLETKNEIGLEIHSGRNRIVRRIFESLGYDVVKLDRVMYAGLTKKNVSRGKWRFLSEKEVIQLKHFRT